MNLNSEWSFQLALEDSRAHGKRLDIKSCYLACVASSNIGRLEPEEAQLSKDMQCLLKARRLLFKNNFNEVKKLLNKKINDEFLNADKYCLLAIAHYRAGDNIQKAHEFFIKAATIYKKLGETYRYLRAQTNALIVARDLNLYVNGSLYSLEQLCIRESCWDLAACIARGRGIESLTQGYWEAAREDFKKASERYQLDGCAEERAVSQLLLAISLRLNNESEESKKCAASILMKSPRIESYIQILHSLEKNQIPLCSKEHPLHKVPWSKYVIAHQKNSSFSSKIIDELKKSPKSKSQLISILWGVHANGSSYDNRLHVALNVLRKKRFNIEFNGSTYTLKDNSL